MKLNFGQAIAELQNGKLVARIGWNGKNMYLFLVTDWLIRASPVDSIPVSGVLPFICMKTAQDDFVPWLASQTDVLAEDWMVVG